MGAAESVRDAQDRLAVALAAVEEAERDLRELAEQRACSAPIILWARLRADGTVNSQALRVSREGAEGATKWDRQRGRLVRLLCYVDPSVEIRHAAGSVIPLTTQGGREAAEQP